MSTLSFGPLSRIVVLSLVLLLVGGIVAAGSGASNPSGELEGKVVDEIGEPIEGADVEIQNSSLSDTTGPDGKYSIDNVPYETQDVEVTATDYHSEMREVAVSTDNSPVTEDFTLERTREDVSGTVTSSSNGPIDDIELENVDISVTHQDSDDQQLIDELDLTTETTTDADGNFDGISVPTGEISITATKDGFDEKSASDKDVDTGPFSLELDENATTVDGFVTNQNGDGIEDADVEVMPDSSNVWTEETDTTTTTNSSGYYEIEEVPVSTTGAERIIKAEAENFEPKEQSVEIEPDKRVDSFELSQDKGNFELTVEDEFGNALDGINVEVDDAEYETSNGVVNTRLPFGTHDVVIDHPDYEQKTNTTEIRPDETTDESVEITRETDVRLDIESVTPDSWQSGDEVDFEVSFEEEVYNEVDWSVDGPESNPEQVDSGTFGTGFDDSFTGNDFFAIDDSLDDGRYTLSVSALGETKSQSFEVSNVFDSDEVDFSEDEYRSVAGDFVEVDISIGDQDEAYILMGGDRDADSQNFENHLDVLHVNGDATFIINTRLVGTDRPSEDVFIPIDGDVTSYAHDLGADSEPEGDFDGVTFERDGGGEIASTLAEFREEMGVSSRGSPLQASRYRMVAGGDSRIIEGDDGIPDVQHPVARSNLVLTQPELGSVTTYTLPPGAADEVDQFDDDDDQLEIGDIGTILGDATETDTVAEGDRILIEVQTSGIFGALLGPANPAVDDSVDGTGQIIGMDSLLNSHEGVHIELSDSELAGPNRPGADLRFSGVASSDMYILPDDSTDQWEGDTLGDEPVAGGFYIVIDTRGSDPFDGRPTDGDELTFEMAYESPDGERYQYQDYSIADGEKPDPFDPAVSPDDGVEHFPYFGSRDTTVSVNSSFVFEEPYIDYGETTVDDELLVPAEDGGVISGETNIAPGSDAEIQLVASNRPDPKLITIENVEITEDRTFEVTEDFSAFEPGERVEVEFYTQGRLTDDRIIDKRGVRVVDDLDNPSNFEITDHTESAEVMRGTRLSDIEATITNTGDIADRQQVRFELDNEPVKQETVTLDSGEQETLDLSDSFVMLSPGTYTYTVETDDDEQSGELTVTEPDDETAEQLDSLDTDSAAVEDDPEETPEDEPDDADGFVGLFGIQRRDIAVAATVTGAMHILGQWT